MPGECATSTATYETTPVTSATRTQMEILARRLIMGPNDEVERRGASPASNEGTLSQSSTPSLAHRRRGPRSLEPIVRLLRSIVRQRPSCEVQRCRVSAGLDSQL